MESSYTKAISVNGAGRYRGTLPLSSVHMMEKTELPFLERDKFPRTIQLAKDKEIPSNFKKLSKDEIAHANSDPRSPLLSKQEKGIRPSNALPYELYADGAMADGKFELHMTAANAIHGSRSAGSPFNVYLRNARIDSGAKSTPTKPRAC